MVGGHPISVAATSREILTGAGWWQQVNSDEKSQKSSKSGLEVVTFGFQPLGFGLLNID